MLKSQLFWIGTLMRLATGFWSFFASSPSLAFSSSAALPSPEEVASGGARVGESECRIVARLVVAK
jgi:hypothetical protein